jgi:hypothetical protein
MVLVFTNNPEAPVECALEISKALQSHPKLKVRGGSVICNMNGAARVE